MAIPTVHTWTSLEVPSSATLQSQISDPITFALNPPAACVARVATQSMANSTGTYLTFDTEVFDNRAMYAGGTTDTVSITESGFYAVMGYLLWDVSSSGIRVLELHQNGVTITATSEVTVASPATHRSVICGGMVCAVGDLVKLNTYQSSGGSLNVTGRMSVFRVSG